MAIHPQAGKPATPDMLVDAAKLERDYYGVRADPADPSQRVAFGTSGHRGTTAHGSFTEAHILAITEAICEYRRSNGINGPLFLGKDTHLLSGPAERSALEVLAGNGVEVFIQRDGGFTPTPVISRSILVYNHGRQSGLSDGIIISPSHNPPPDGGFKYNPPNGGPADTDVTSWVERRANELLAGGDREVKRIPYERALRAGTTHVHDFCLPYVRDLVKAIDMEAIRGAKLRIGADPLGGSAVGYWAPIGEVYGIAIEVVNPAVDPTFRFMTVDHDGKIRMDCSSPWAMAGLVGLKDRFDVAFGNDPDADRHGVVTPSLGLLNPNHYLAVAIEYLLANRPEWSAQAAIGKTLVSSSMIDRVVHSANRRLAEVPVGFKWFAGGLFTGELCFGGEESAGASFVERTGAVWTTDKDGILLNLLAAEITARTGKDPGVHYRELTERFGTPHYRRIDAPASPEQKARLKKLSPGDVKATELAGEPIVAKLTRAPANDAPIDGLKVETENGWFAARPSGTENLYKIYAESFGDEAHLAELVLEARQIVTAAIGG